MRFPPFFFQTFDPVSSLNYTPTPANNAGGNLPTPPPGKPNPPSIFSLFTPTKTSSGDKNNPKYGEQNQSAIIDNFFQQKREGFFVEAGAWDGEYLSNTKFFEKERNWTGLLIEPNKEAFR